MNLGGLELGGCDPGAYQHRASLLRDIEVPIEI